MPGLRSVARRRDEGGAAAVEFALVAPLLIFLLFAIISYGYMLSFRQSLSQAAAEGSRAAAVAAPGLSDLQIDARARAAVNSALGSYGVTCTSDSLLKRGGALAGTCLVSAKHACVTSTVGAQCVKVSLDYTYKDDALLPSFPGLGILLPEHLAYATESQVS